MDARTGFTLPLSCQEIAFSLVMWRTLSLPRHVYEGNTTTCQSHCRKPSIVVWESAELQAYSVNLVKGFAGEHTENIRKFSRYS
jgi:hypothetical protein